MHHANDERDEQREQTASLLMSTPEEREHLLRDKDLLDESPNFNIANDPYNHMMRVVFSKWKPFILRAIYLDGGTYFSRFFKQLPITQKVLSQNLKQLQDDGLIYRIVLPEIPPRVSYHLTRQGASLIPILDLVYDWGWNDMRQKGLPVDALGEMWHGYRKPDADAMDTPYKK